MNVVKALLVVVAAEEENAVVLVGEGRRGGVGARGRALTARRGKGPPPRPGGEDKHLGAPVPATAPAEDDDLRERGE